MQPAARSQSADDLFNVYQTCEYLTAAAGSYGRMLELNKYLAESDNARYLPRADYRDRPIAPLLTGDAAAPSRAA